MLDLDSPRWAEMWHMYTDGQGGSDVPDMLRRIENAPDEEEFREALGDFWEAVYHQGDFCAASYAVTPHLARISRRVSMARRGVLCMCIALIEMARKNQTICRAEVSEDIAAEYHCTLSELPKLIAGWLDETWDRDVSIDFTAAILTAKGHSDLSRAVLDFRAQRVLKCSKCGTYVPIPQPCDDS